MIRQFKLRNEYSREYNLNVPDTAFLYEPSGLGYEMDYSFMRLGYSWVRNFMKDKQMEIQGTVVFTSHTPYQDAAEFLKFVRTSSKLTLVYTTAVGEYLRDVDIVSYEKTEIVEAHTLQCPIVMIAKGLWYSNNVTKFSITIDNTGDVLRYAYKFPSRFQSVVGGSVAVSNDGSVQAPFTVVFHGAIVNPSMVLLVDGEETARIDIIGEAGSGESIKYSSVDGDLYIYHEDADGVQTNLMAGLDINNANFFKIPIGESELQFSAAETITQPIIISMQKLYRAV